VRGRQYFKNHYILRFLEAENMGSVVIEEESVAKATRKAIEAVCEHGIKTERIVGEWCMMKPGRHRFHEIHNAIITITNPVKRWNSRVNAGMLTETEDYLLGLNPGYTHMSTWGFYKKWILEHTGKYPYTYGERIFGAKNEINQWQEVVKLLRKNPTTRHGHVTIYRADDLRRDFVPCNFAWHFQIDNHGRLNMITFCRSQDALRGLFLDCFAYTHFLEQMALATNLPLGNYTVFEVNLHIYDRDKNKIDTDFAKPTEPYSEGISPTGAPFLTRKDKTVMYELSRKIFENVKTPNIDEINLPGYWKDWIIFIATEMLMKTQADLNYAFSKVQNREILWTLKKSLARCPRSSS
jgi:thymidylate synthase